MNLPGNAWCKCDALSVTLLSKVREKKIVIVAGRLCRALQIGDSPVRRAVVQPKTTDRSKVTPRHSGQLFNTSTDKVKLEEKAEAHCFT